NTPSSAAAKVLQDTYGNDVVNERPAEGGFLQVVSKRMTSAWKTNREEDAQKSQFSEQLQVATDENLTCNTEQNLS
ncbi:hypothetical protein ACTXT7_017574, partial [Hymenolepis weldensis]